MRRRIVIILLLLVGGAVVNVAVAWGCVWRVWPPGKFPVEVTEREVFETTSGDLVVATDRSERVSLGYRAFFDVVITEWPPRSAVTTKTIHAGLPLPTLAYERRDEFVESEHSVTHRGMIGFGRQPLWPMRRTQQFYPINPIWTGFIINTIFYALLLWLLLFAPLAARRMLRRRRGQCEKCAYPIGVSAVCTECGAAVVRHEPRARQNEPRA